MSRLLTFLAVGGAIVVAALLVSTPVGYLAIAIFVVVLIALAAGRRIGRRPPAKRRAARFPGASGPGDPGYDGTVGLGEEGGAASPGPE